MNDAQQRVIALAAYAIAFALFVFFFGQAAWEWATWNRSEVGRVLQTSKRP